MTSEPLAALVRQYFEEAVDRPDLYEEIQAEGFRVHPVHHATVMSDEGSGPAAFKAFAAWLHSIWSSPAMRVEDVFSDGERVAARWTFYGRHDHGPFLGVPPTGEDISYSGITLFRVEHGKLAEGWALFDRLWLFQQLGVVSETGEFLARAARPGTTEPEG